ncbi:hypothetical protein [Desulfopila sp. IMCC35008]|uniref:hypothetical protein n=1 Tax=Desulfopila sp. IMCC35008 TaxID=2653858 RepID=UPI0013D66F18|nr:hypothetical protein [Desulfopila sp. IMCC35008]
MAKDTKECENRLGRTANRPIWGLWFSIGIRAIHQVGAAMVLAAIFLIDGSQVPSLYLYLAGGSGVVLCIAEGARHRQMHREFSGMITVLKCVLLGFAFHGFVNPAFGVTCAFLIASVGAHAPRHVRHRLLY